MSCPVPAGFHALPLPIVQLSLTAVLKCGQSFRWSIFPLSSVPVPSSYPTHEYRVCLRDRVVCLRQSPDTLYYRTVLPSWRTHPQCSASEEATRLETLDWIQDYFQLDVDLVGLYDTWSNKDPVFRSFRSRFQGIRVLRQDPWENLISFICSSNNNISRITKMVTSLCEHFSSPLLSLPPPQKYSLTELVTSGLPSPRSTPIPTSSSSTLFPGHSVSDDTSLQAYYPFPHPTALASTSVASTLRGLGFGYRAEYVQKTAQLLIEAQRSDTDKNAEMWLKALRNTSVDEAREALLGFMGVGRKVADCVLLMSLDKKDVIPVDTHVHQIAMKYYGVSSKATKSNGKIPMTPKIYDEVNTKLAQVWGDYAGWAHSVLFTADLKSFSTYGIDLSPTRNLADVLSQLPIPTPPVTPSPSPERRIGKRKNRTVSERAQVQLQGTPFDTPRPNEIVEAQCDVSLSLAERVKKRRRITTLSVP